MTSATAYSADRPKTVTVTTGANQQVIRNLTFLPFGPRTRAEFPPYDSGTSANTVISTRSYNLRGQVSALQVTSPLGTVLDQSFTYGYIGGAPGPVDGGPNLDQVVDNRDGSQSRFFFYDALDRLWKSTSLSGTPLFTYVYDANGNRTQQVAPAGTTNYSYASSTDRITQATGAAAKSYAHDAFGNRVWAGPTAYAGTPSHVYDQGNRLIEVRDPTTQAVLGQYTYDAAGRRVRKVAGGVTTLFFYDSAGHLVESQNLSTSPATRRSYVFVEDEPVGVVDQPPSGSPAFSWIHTDRLGTPLAVTSTPASGSAQVIWRATYAPFGLATPNEDPDGDSQSFAINLRLPGQIFDAESDVSYNGYRTYDPMSGRYLEVDPLGQLHGRPEELNPYLYALGRPTSAIDPLGLYYCVYSIATHSLTCVANDVGNPDLSDSKFLSGNNLDPQCPVCRDNPDHVNFKNHGPIPTGFYVIGAQKPFSTKRPLTPDPKYNNNMFGRNSFQTHYCPNPSKCSDGCIATPDLKLSGTLNRLLGLEEGRNRLTVVP